MPSYLNDAINFFVVWLDRHNLFAFFSFGHLYHLPLGQVAQIPKILDALKLVSMAIAEACRRTANCHNDTLHRICQYLCGRIGVCQQEVASRHFGYNASFGRIGNGRGVSQ